MLVGKVRYVYFYKCLFKAILSTEFEGDLKWVFPLFAFLSQCKTRGKKASNERIRFLTFLMHSSIIVKEHIHNIISNGGKELQVIINFNKWKETKNNTGRHVQYYLFRLNHRKYSLKLSVWTITLPYNQNTPTLHLYINIYNISNWEGAI